MSERPHESPPFVPPLEPAAVWRPLRLTDAPALSDLSGRIDAVERLQEVPGPELFAWILALPSVGLADNTIGGFDHRSRLLATAQVMVRGGDGHRRAIIWVTADPDHVDLEPLLLGWAEGRARARLADAPADAETSMRVIVEEHRHRYRAFLDQAGYRPGRTFVRMALPLPATPTAPDLPEGITIVPWSDEWDRGAWQVSNESFRDHWGAAGHDWAEWRAHYAEDPDAFLPDHSFLAVADGQVVAICLAEFDPEQDDKTGTREFWVGRVGTIADWRRRGLGTALVVRSLRAASASGFDRALLTVDEESHTGATRIYERIGFEALDRELHYVKDA